MDIREGTAASVHPQSRVRGAPAGLTDALRMRVAAVERPPSFSLREDSFLEFLPAKLGGGAVIRRRRGHAASELLLLTPSAAARPPLHRGLRDGEEVTFARAPPWSVRRPPGGLAGRAFPGPSLRRRTGCARLRSCLPRWRPEAGARRSPTA